MLRTITRFHGKTAFVFVVALLAFVFAVSVSLASDGGPDLDDAINAEEGHKDLLARPGVVALAAGFNPAGLAVVKIYTEDEGVGGLPEELDGVPVEVLVSGKIVALACPPPTNRCTRPVPIGVSTGHPDITAGTIGARVKDTGGAVYALSNNHVYANENLASLGDYALQPGPFDGGIVPTDSIGTLSDFEPIAFNNESACVANVVNCNIIDAAIALSTTANLGNETLAGGYGKPQSTTVTPSVGLSVQKYGRTTGQTTGSIAAVNAYVT